MVANGDRAVRLFGVAVDPEFLDIFDLPFVAGDSRTAFAAPRSAVLTREYSARLFGSDDPIGKTILIGNAIDTTVTGVIDPIREPSHMGRSANAPLPFDLLASRDVLDAIRGNPGGFAGPGGGWTFVGTTVYLYLPPAGGLSADALAAQLDGFVARHVPAESVTNPGLPFRRRAGRQADDRDRRFLRHRLVVRSRVVAARRSRARRRVRELREPRNGARRAARARDRRAQGVGRLACADRGAELVRGRRVRARGVARRARGVRPRATARQESARHRARCELPLESRGLAGARRCSCSP